jgi:transposase
MLKIVPKQYNFHSILYNKIPENHILKKIASVLDFSFINSMLESTYCIHYGRPAKEPEMMVKLLILQYLYNLSDERVIEEGNLNIAFLWFLGLNPEEKLPEASLLTKFRKHRLQGIAVDEIITEVVRQCVENGIIKGGSISIDATHTETNTKKKIPERIMKHLARKILKNYEKESESIPEDINTNIPDFNAIEDHNEAKTVMKDYVESLIDQVTNNYNEQEMPKTKAAIEKTKAVLRSPQFIEQKGIRSIVDEDARVGHKSKTESFFGYKTEFTMLTDEKIITAVNVYNGAYVDGTDTKSLIEHTLNANIDIKEFYGDKAYFRKHILDEIKEINATAYIPVSETVYRIDESKYTYNKDSDEWYCDGGNKTVDKKKKKRIKSGQEYEYYRYYFQKDCCKNCPKREDCIGKKARKILDISLNTPEFYQLSQWQKTDQFKEKYKQRAYHEAKNGEMKQHHGLTRSRGYGLRSMQIQSKLTALAVNLKRIAKLVSSLNYVISHKLYFFNVSARCWG